MVSVAAGLTKKKTKLTLLWVLYFLMVSVITDVDAVTFAADHALSIWERSVRRKIWGLFGDQKGNKHTQTTTADYSIL